MGKITPFDKQNPELWKQHNEEAIKKIHDDALKLTIRLLIFKCCELEITSNS